MNTAAEEAFAGVPQPARYGHCHRCHEKTERGGRVNVRVAATGMHPDTGTQNQSLGSHGRTFCPTCARAVFDECSQHIESGDGS